MHTTQENSIFFTLLFVVISFDLSFLRHFFSVILKHKKKREFQFDQQIYKEEKKGLKTPGITFWCGNKCVCLFVVVVTAILFIG